MTNKYDNFEVVEKGTAYQIPNYKIEDNVGIVSTDTSQTITFVRGDRQDEAKTIFRVDGIVHEQLLGIMIYDLQYKNSLVPSRETSLAITKLEEALHWLEARQKDRSKRDVQGTYKK